MSSSSIGNNSSSSRFPVVDDERFFSLSRELTDDERFISFSRELTDDDNSRKLKPSNSTRVRVSKASYVSAFLGKVGRVGLKVLDTVGSSMINIIPSSELYPSNSDVMGAKISIIAFEVANTVVKGLNLRQSLSDENIQILKNETLLSKAVQLLVSTDMKELLRIAATDKREEFRIFSGEVVRFGNMCIDPQWHNLDRFFVSSDFNTLMNKQLREEVEMTMQELSKLAQYTAGLYVEYKALDIIEQSYLSRIEELESLHIPRKGENLMILASETRIQRKIVRHLKRKSLWSQSRDEMAMPEIKAEMDKTLHWLVPVATNTIKAHQSFGWIGEWENTGFEFGKKTEGSNNIKWLQTLYHADKHKTYQYILDLVILLHRLVNLANSQLPVGQLQRVKTSPEDKNLLEEVRARS